MSKYDLDTVQRAASGRWGDVLTALSPNLAPAVEKRGRHVPCPIHGGRDGFRVFRDFETTGGGICNTCGSFPSGFKLLEWSTGRRFSDVVDMVGDYVCPNEKRKNARDTRTSVPTGGRITGVIEDSGESFLYGDPERGLSWFVSIVDANQVRRVLWGKSLRNALEEAGLGTGDEVTFTKRDETRPDDRYRRIIWKAERACGPSVFEEAERRRAEAKAAEASKPGTEDAKPAVTAGAQRIWDESLELDFSDPVQNPLRKYLLGRGISNVTDADLRRMQSVRFHPALPYYDQDLNVVGKFPAMVCAIRRKNGEIVNLHRIYLSEEGTKAPVEEPKKMTMVAEGNTVSGAAIALLEPEQNAIAVAEGIETALSVTSAIGIPAWSCVSAGMMERFDPPSSVRVVFIFADKDRSETGQKAAEVLKNALTERGLTVRVYLPEAPIPAGKKGIDWNDVLMRDGPSGFPKLRLL